MTGTTPLGRSHRPLVASTNAAALPSAPADESATLLRSLTLPSSAVVLEVACGAGSRARYLGGRVAHVDAIESDAALAAAASVTTAAVPNVAVYVAALPDVPVEAAYDLVVLGNADATMARFPDAVATASALLRPGGSLVLLGSNPLAVAGLAGGAAGTGPNRRTLERAAVASGLHPHTYAVFPNLSHPRVVMDVLALEEAAPTLVGRLPVFPSVDVPDTPPRVADEASLWATSVSAGLGADMANAFLLIARGESARPLWHPRHLAVYWSQGRRPEQSTENIVVRRPSGVVLKRRPVLPQTGAPRFAVRLVSGVEKYVAGEEFTDLLAETGSAVTFGRVLARWERLIARLESASSVVLWDAVPHNLVRRGRSLVAIDQEWELVDGDWDVVRRRGLFWLAARLAQAGGVPEWVGERPIGEIAEIFGQTIGVAPGWLDAFIAEEAVNVIGVWPAAPGRTPAWFEKQLRNLAASTPSVAGAPALLVDEYRAAIAGRRRARLQVRRLRAELQQLREIQSP